MNACIPIHMSIHIHMAAATATKRERLGAIEDATHRVGAAKEDLTKKMVLEWWTCPTMRGSWSLWTEDVWRERDFLGMGC